MQRILKAAVAAVVMAAGPLVAITPASAATVQVSVKNFKYDPSPAEVQPGDTVTWTNNDAVPHTVNADDGSFGAYLDPGETFSRTFATGGTVPYFCKLHGGPGGEGMSGVVQVGPRPPGAITNLAAADNVASAIEWSKLSYKDGEATLALLGRSDGFADALSSGGPQGKLHAPLLLTPSNALDPRVRAELTRLGTRTVYLLGGTAALSRGVEDELRAAGLSVRRIAGGDRISTALAVADAFAPEATGAVLVRAFGDGTRAFADALGAGAFSARTGQPVLFSETDKLSDATRGYLASHPIHRVVIVGGEAAINAAVEKALTDMKIEIERAAGNDRFGTAAKVAVADLPEDVQREGPEEIVLVDGTAANAWADGFSAAGRRSPVLLTSGDVIPSSDAIADTGDQTALTCGTTVTDKACARAEVIRSADTEFPAIAAQLNGQDRPPGDPNATEAFGVYPTVAPTAICADFFPVPLDVAAAEIRAKSGDQVAITVPIGPSPFDEPFGCAFDVAQATVADVLANPTKYYVALPTAEFAKGAVTGDLFKFTFIATADMAGEAEIPGPGDPQGGGFAFVVATDDPAELCVGVFAFGLSSEITAAHIHQGGPNAAGSIVVPLKVPSGEGLGPIACYNAGTSLVSSIKTNPTGFYINVHTKDLPNGAIRGNLYPPQPGG